ncbi:unnamed protein product, partial [Laminaria digitata]
AETEDRVGGGAAEGAARAAAASAPDLDHTAAITTTTTTTTTTAATTSGGGGHGGATDAPPNHVAAHQGGGARPAGDDDAAAGAAHTAERGEASHNNNNVPAHQELQPPLPATVGATATVPAPTTRAMVPDKEDDDDDPAGGASAQRQHTLQNYASRDSGAVMLESSPASKGMANLLVDSKDKYAISPCEDKQWAVLGLSEDIRVRTIRLSSHEKYSSLVKDFQVLASQSYPVNEWLDLGTFTAKFVQGEQTFDLPDPAFARYLKFKFLSHYGDEFYCTVSQVKVHGATMLESFQDEWQQSSADVREVQDYIKKKDPKPSATGIGGTNGNVSHHGVGVSVGGVGANGANGANGGHPPAATPGVRAQQAAPSEAAPASTPPSSDGGVEHRPHAASAATVPPGDKRPIGGNGNGNGGGGGGGTGPGGGGGAGAGTATVEDIVRGVPAEMVVPASTACAGPTGTDGSCPGEVLTDRAGGGGGGGGEEAAAAGGGGSTTLGEEIPSMGGGGDAGKPQYTAGGGGGAGAAGEAGGGGSIGQGADDLGHPIGGGEAAGAGGGLGGGMEGVGGGQQEPGADFSGGGSTGKGNVGHQAGQGLADVDGSEAPERTGGSGAAAGEGVGSADVPSDGGAGEKKKEEDAPPRKGIIHSTMEALSKAVTRGEGSKAKDTGASKKPLEAAAGSGEPGGGTAPPGGAAEGQAGDGAAAATNPLPPPPTAASLDAGSGVGGDGAIGGGVDVGTNLGAAGEGAAAAGAAAAGGGSRRPPATGHSGWKTSGGRGTSDPGAGDPVGGAAGGAAHSTGATAAGGGEPREGSAADDARGELAQGRPPQKGHGEGVADSGTTQGGSKAGAENVPASTRSEPTAAAAGGPRAHAGAGGDWEGGDRPELNAGLPLGGDGTETTEGTGRTGAASAFQEEAADVNDRLQRAEWTLDVEGAGAGAGTGSVSHVAVLSETGDCLSSQGEVPPGDQGGAYSGSTEGGAWHAEGADAHANGGVGADEAALVAACMDRLSFADFRDEVLTRTQQAQQAPGGGVAIGGQYESIFKTLMNKIKTLEINQSLFSLYIDDVHVCYQEVIAQMLREQERARASRSELLSAQAAHLVQIGDQWPAFQELQAKVLEVENRMLLSSMAWFTSLFCLVVLVCNCFFKLFRRCVLGPHPGRDYWAGGGGREGGRRSDRGEWTHRCANCSPLGRGAAAVFS